MTKEQLKKRYDGKKIEQIEGEIRDSRSLSYEGQREMIFALSYLRTSGRHKENTLYRESSFEVYLKGQFNMRLGTFMEQ